MRNLRVMSVMIFVTLAVILTVIALVAVDGTPNNGVFDNTTGEIARKYETNITPANYAFSIWGLIYLWQLAWIVYVITTIFRKNEIGRIIVHPLVLSLTTHILYILACICTIIWLFLWDMEHIIGSSITLVAISAFGIGAVLHHSMLTEKREDHFELGEMIAVHVLIQNGMGIFFSWTTVASLLNISAALTYGPADLSSETSSIICIIILALLAIGWAALENTVMYQYVRYYFIWYAVAIWALIAILVKNNDPVNASTILTAILLCSIVLCLIAKIVVLVVKTRNARDPERATFAK